MTEIYTALFKKTGSSDIGSGDYNVYISNSDSKDEDGFEIDDSDYDIFIEEVSHRKSQKKEKLKTYFFANNVLFNLSGIHLYISCR